VNYINEFKKWLPLLFVALLLVVFIATNETRAQELMDKCKLGGGVGWFNSPAIADIDGDGVLEMVVGARDGLVYAIGPGCHVLWTFDTTDAIKSSPAVGDIDGDGDLEVVIGSDSNYVYALNGEDGSLLWNYETDANVYSSPALGDIDGDGDIEVVIGSIDDYIYALNGENGSLLWKFETDYDVVSSPALGDIDGDGDIEVVIGSKDDYIYALNGENGSLLWKFEMDYDVTSSPALGDIDGDGDIEVVVGSADTNVYAINGEDGSLLWRYETGDYVTSSPALGDTDGDGDIEVVVGSYDSYVYAINGEDGSLLWRYETDDVVESSPALGEVDGDEGLEVVIGSSDDSVYILNAEDGSLVWYFKTGGGVNSSPALADVNADGYIEIVVGSWDEHLYVFGTGGTRVPVLPGPWPKFRGGPANLGRFALAVCPPEFTLSPNVPVTGVVEPGFGLHQYCILVSREAADTGWLAIGLSSSGNLDLHVRHGRPVASGKADFSLVSPDGNEFIIISHNQLQPGTYFIAVENLETTPQEFTLVACPLPYIHQEAFPSLGVVEPPALDVLSPHLSTERGLLSFLQYRIRVPRGVSQLTLRIEGLEGGNADVHVRYARPVEVKGGEVIADLSSLSPASTEVLILADEFLREGIYYIAVEAVKPPLQFRITVTLGPNLGKSAEALVVYGCM